jgi:DNA primase
MAGDAYVDAAGVPVRISSPDKVVFPDRGWTKLDIAEHFAMCGEGALRNVFNRPTMLKRWTKGVQAEPFYVKRVPAQARSTVDVTFPSARPGTMFLPLEIQDVVWMAQMNCLDLHPWNARASDLDHPDELRVDLDPGPAHRDQQDQGDGRPDPQPAAAGPAPDTRTSLSVGHESPSSALRSSPRWPSAALRDRDRSA